MVSPLTRTIWSAKAGTRDALRFTFWHCGLASVLGRALGRDRRVVLVYHTVGEPSPVVNPSNVLPETTFVRHLEMIRRSSRPVVSLERILDFTRPLPEGGVALTFDDGYRGCLDVVAPLLEEREYPATFYVCPGFIDRKEGKWDDLLLLALPDFNKSLIREPRATVEAAIATAKTAAGADRLRAHADALLGWDELRRLKARGFSVQSHTVNHFYLSVLEDDELRHELVDSKARVDVELDQDTTSVAYPFGFPGCFDQRAKEIASAAGYRWAVQLGDRYLEPRTELFEVPRFGMHPRLRDWQLRLIFSGILPS